jgi:hypothetical protein
MMGSDGKNPLQQFDDWYDKQEKLDDCKHPSDKVETYDKPYDNNTRTVKHKRCTACQDDLGPA